MQIKTTTKYHFTSIKMVIYMCAIFFFNVIPNVSEEVEKLEPSYIVSGM